MPELQEGQPERRDLAAAGRRAGQRRLDPEESLDLDMVSAICPLCNIVLVEATSDSGTGLDVAENAAATLGAKYVSNSWGGGESSSDTTLRLQYFNHPGVVITASAGDSATA